MLVGRLCGFSISESSFLCVFGAAFMSTGLELLSIVLVWCWRFNRCVCEYTLSDVNCVHVNVLRMNSVRHFFWRYESNNNESDIFTCGSQMQ